MNLMVDYIVVGLGLAGLTFSEQLRVHNKSFIVFEDNSQTSSLVASGMYNPVVLKRFTPVFNGHQQLQIAIPFYKKLEKKFNTKFDTKLVIKRVFGSIEDQKKWLAASNKPMLSLYMNPVIYDQKIDGIISNFGFGKLTGTGKIDTQKLVSIYRKYLQKQHKICFEKFEYSKIQFYKQFIKYKNIIAKKIVFCEGFGVKQNPFFQYLPLNEAKGELITIYAPDLNIKFSLKSTASIVPLANHYYRVGATFNWTDKTCFPTQQDKKELIKKLEKTITTPYQIVNQSAAIRPTVKDRIPLIGIHPKYKQLMILNGLGTRGVMIAPTIAKNLFNHVEKREKLDPLTDIKRFS